MEGNYKHVKKIERETGTAYVYYNKLPTKEDLEEACALFMREVNKELIAQGKEPY